MIQVLLVFAELASLVPVDDVDDTVENFFELEGADLLSHPRMFYT